MILSEVGVDNSRPRARLNPTATANRSVATLGDCSKIYLNCEFSVRVYVTRKYNSLQNSAGSLTASYYQFSVLSPCYFPVLHVTVRRLQDDT